MKRKNIKWALGGLAAGITGLLLLDALILEEYFFKVKVFDIGNKGSSKKVRLVLLTDLHIKKALLPHHRRLAEKVNQLQPDLLLITGDTP